MKREALHAHCRRTHVSLGYLYFLIFFLNRTERPIDLKISSSALVQKEKNVVSLLINFNARYFLYFFDTSQMHEKKRKMFYSFKVGCDIHQEFRPNLHLRSREGRLPKLVQPRTDHPKLAGRAGTRRGVQERRARARCRCAFGSPGTGQPRARGVDGAVQRTIWASTSF